MCVVRSCDNETFASINKFPVISVPLVFIDTCGFGHKRVQLYTEKEDTSFGVYIYFAFKGIRFLSVIVY